MGLVRARVGLKNPRRPELQPVEVEVLRESASVSLFSGDATGLPFEGAPIGDSK